MAISKDLVTVVVPTFNEEEATGLVLDELFEAGYKNVLTVMVRLRLLSSIAFTSYQNINRAAGNSI